MARDSARKFSKFTASLSAVYDEYQSQGPHAVMAAPRAVPLAMFAGHTVPSVRVFIHCKSKTDLDAIDGVQVYQATGKVRTASVRLDKLEELAEVSGVTRIAATRKLRPLMDQASLRTNLATYRAGNPSGRTGKGVLVGIVDTGIDAAHPAFAGRILSVWDQTISGHGWGSTTYGVVLTGPAMVASLDTDGHGTHVAGIAAGASTTYGGVAPEADLIVVKTNFQDTGIGDAIRYIFEEADRLNRPAVVNLSLGGHWDPHDGTDDLSANLDALTAAGRIVVVAAGNENEAPIHATVDVPAGGTVALKFSTLPSTNPASPPWVVLNGWYPGNASLEVAVRTSAGDLTPLQAVIAPPASPVGNHNFTTAKLRLTTPPATANPNGDHQFLIEIQPGAVQQQGAGGYLGTPIEKPGRRTPSARMSGRWSMRTSPTPGFSLHMKTPA
ncbi:MAG: S8 family serine peptidase [Pirellulales bacterium]